jgi:NDP-sugar pyrophosphorylase family protein
MNGRNLIILAGGISSRMKKSVAGDIDPTLRNEAGQKAKSMIGLGEGKRPLLDYLLWNAERAGYEDIVLVVGENDHAFRQQYGSADRNNRFHALEISYAIQKIPAGRVKPFGTADALLQAMVLRRDWRGDAFTVCNSDNLYSEHALRRMLQAGSSCGMLEYDRDALGFDPARTQQFAVVEKDAEGLLVDIIEKPRPEQITRVMDAGGRVGVSMNLFRFGYDAIFPFVETAPLHPVRLEKELPTAVMMMVHLHPHSMKVFSAAEQVPDLTSIQDVGVIETFLRSEYRKGLWQ